MKSHGFAALSWMALLTGLAWAGAKLPEGPAEARKGKPCARVAIFEKSLGAHREVAEIMRKELKDLACVTEIQFDRDTPFSVLRDRMRSEAPAVMVLMDNEAVDFGLKYNSGEKKPVPGVALMGLNLRSVLKDNRMISGIAYEPPGFSLITQFRYILNRPIRNVLVLYRKSEFREMVESARSELKLEGVTLEPRDLEADEASGSLLSGRIARELQALRQEPGKYDAVWVLLDSELLKQSTLAEAWIPAARGSGVPFLASSDVLVAADMQFATFAVTPNHADMAVQAVQQVEQLLVRRAAPAEIGVENVVSVNKVLNLRRARELGLSLREERLGDVRRVE
jgi:hypothetical protein